jgi:FtsP/CotA-like multicopper oxidase with cupredoxin domain
MMNRRDFGLSLAAGLSLPALAHANTGHVLRASAAKMQIAPSQYPETDVWCYNNAVPGEVLRVKQGAELATTFENHLPEPSSVHWHGIRLKNSMDGVPDLTQKVVPANGRFDYRFATPDAGTYWYHAHNRSWEQVARGLYGPLIVEETTPPDVDHDITVVIDDWRITENAQISDDFGSMHDLSHDGRIGNYLTAQLLPRPAELRKNERVRLRFINTATDRIVKVGFHGLEGALVALDGMPLQSIQKTDHTTLAPAQRADFIVDVIADTAESALIISHESDGGYILADVPVKDAKNSARGAIHPLPPNPIDAAQGKAEQSVLLVMDGGAMGGLRSGVFNGQKLSMRELISKGMIWTLNGTAGMPETPLLTASKGSIVEIPLVNETAFGHAMHMHGNHFQERLADGTLGPHRDTLLVNRGETRTIVFAASNPGKWLIHCHMLSHQAAGMKTYLEVV